MLRHAFLPLLLVAASATVAAAQAPPRPLLPRGADPNAWETYFDHGVTLLRADNPVGADEAFYWAERLNPARAEPLYGHFVALHLRNVDRWREYMSGSARLRTDPAILRGDSLLVQAQVRNPFVHRGLTLVLYQASPVTWGFDSYTQGMLDYFTGAFPAAQRKLADNVRRNPRSLEGRWSLVLALVSAGEMERAQAEMDVLLAQMRERDDTRLVRMYESKEMQEYAAGLLHLARGQDAAARAAMEQALVENAAAWFAHRGRAMALRREGRADEAVQEMAAALELAPDDAWLRYEYAAALLGARRFADAAAELRKATAREPYWSDAWLALGDAERLGGHAPEALAAYERYLPLAPRSEASTVETVRRLVEGLRATASAAH